MQSNEGNLDEKTDKCKLFQPTGLSVEFNNVIHLVDSRPYCIMIFSTLHETAKFLETIRNLYKYFFVDESEFLSCSFREMRATY